MPAFRFRYADEPDAPVIAELVESGYRGERSRAGWTTEADLLDGQRIDVAGVLAVIRDPASRVLLAEREGEGGVRLLGCAQLERKPGYAYFGMFAVQPSLQNGGIGRAVLAEAERIVREDWALPSMRMSVIVQRAELIAWYERRGYTRSGEYLPFPYGDERFGKPRRDDLRFEILVKRLALAD